MREQLSAAAASVDVAARRDVFMIHRLSLSLLHARYFRPAEGVFHRVLAVIISADERPWFDARPPVLSLTFYVALND